MVVVMVVFAGEGCNNNLNLRILILILRFATPETPKPIEFDGIRGSTGKDSLAVRPEGGGTNCPLPLTLSPIIKGPSNFESLEGGRTFESVADRPQSWMSPSGDSNPCYGATGLQTAGNFCNSPTVCNGSFAVCSAFRATTRMVLRRYNSPFPAKSPRIAPSTRHIARIA